MLAYSCFIVTSLFSLSLQLVESFRTHKKVDVLTGNFIAYPKFRFIYRFSVENGKSLAPRMATDLQDTLLLTRIAGGDLTALEAKYHLACLRNRHRSLIWQSQVSHSSLEKSKIKVRTFVELSNYVAKCVEYGILLHVFLVAANSPHEEASVHFQAC